MKSKFERCHIQMIQFDYVYFAIGTFFASHWISTDRQTEIDTSISDKQNWFDLSYVDTSLVRNKKRVKIKQLRKGQHQKKATKKTISFTLSLEFNSYDHPAVSEIVYQRSLCLLFGTPQVNYTISCVPTHFTASFTTVCAQ